MDNAIFCKIRNLKETVQLNAKKYIFSGELIEGSLSEDNSITTFKTCYLEEALPYFLGNVVRQKIHCREPIVHLISYENECKY